MFEQTVITTPRHVGTCPECGGDVRLEIDETDTDGVPTETGCYYTCEHDDDSHGHTPYVNWLPWEVHVYKWVAAHVRVQSVPDVNGNVVVVDGSRHAERRREWIEVQP